MDDVLAGELYEEWSGSAFSNLTEGDNITLTCAARNIQGPIELPYSSALTITLRVIQSLFYLLIILAGLFLNTLVIVLVAKYKKLQTLSFLVSLQVVVLDLLLSAALLTNLISSIANRWLLGEHMCAITGLVVSVTTITRTLLMGVFVIDRYLAVSWTYFYPKHKKKITLSLSIACWIFSLLIGIAMLPGLLDCYSFSITAKVCLTSSLCSYSCSIYVRVYSGITIPVTVLPIFLYASLYYKARKIQKEMAVMASIAAAAAVKNHRKEWKATITFSLLFISLFVLIVPTTAVAIVIIAISPGGEFSPASYVILVLNSCVVSLLIVTDPIVIMRDGDVKEILKNIKNNILGRRPANYVTSERATTHTTVM